MEPRDTIRHIVLHDVEFLPEDEVQARNIYSGYLGELRRDPVGRVTANALEKLRRGIDMPEDRAIAMQALNAPSIPPATGIPENNPFG